LPDWSGQIAIVTGGGGSIGAAIVAHLAALGARVAWSDITADNRRDTRLRADRIDVSNSSEVTDWISGVTRDWGAPTIGIICAGISKTGHLADLSDADWREVMGVNLDGAFYTARAVVNAMRAARKGGRIVFVGYWAAHAPHPHIGAYSASKAGLRALCRTLALDHAEEGILVNEVAPGIVDAGLSRELFRQDPELASRTAAAIPTGRFATPADVARDVAYLASPENRHTTGSVLVSDGGIGLASTMNPGRAPK
jgi:glucose 1-dehydrogenase